MRKAKELIEPAFSYLGVPYSTMDCQAFVERCLHDIGIWDDEPGSNAWYRRMTWTGAPEECRKTFGKIPVGAFLFILKDSGEPAKYQGDGIGNASHIGIYTGIGQGAIHSSSSKGCVCESKFQGKTIPNGGWNRVGLDQKILDYGLDPGENPEEKEVMGMTAIVTAESGSTVRMRDKPSKSCTDYIHVPVGSDVEVLDAAPVEGWMQIRYDGKVGYMMVQYLKEPEEIDIPMAEPSDEKDDRMVSVMLPYSVALLLMQALTDVMGGKKDVMG